VRCRRLTDQQRYGRFTKTERTQYDTMPERERTAFNTGYNCRNLIENVVDKATRRS